MDAKRKESFEQLHPKCRHETPFIPVTRMGNTIYSAVQQDYLASVWLRRRDKLENSQQKCIVIFALVCCFAVLVALIFSAVDIWGDEDGITEETCSKDCQVVVVENIPEDISFPDNSTRHLALSTGLLALLDRATRSVEIVSSHWALKATDAESGSAGQGQHLFQKLMDLKTRNVNLKVASGLVNSTELQSLSKVGAEVHYLNMTALTKGSFHSSFWVVDKQHMYIGSAAMDWRSLSQTKELGVIIYNCCLALDLHRIFSLYWQLQYKEFVPSVWSKRLTALYNTEKALSLTLNSTKASAYISSSPDVFCPKDRTEDINAIVQVIQDARKFIYISITDYLPLINSSPHRYWSRIDSMLRESLILRRVSVRLLISCWKHTNPLTFNFAWSLKTLCLELSNCTLEVKFFSPREQRSDLSQGINHNKYMVTESSVYLGNFDWVGNEFAYNAGAGLVIQQDNGSEGTVVDQVQAAFERDWSSQYAQSLQADKVPECIRSIVGELPYKILTDSTDASL